MMNLIRCENVFSIQLGPDTNFHIYTLQWFFNSQAPEVHCCVLIHSGVCVCVMSRLFSDLIRHKITQGGRLHHLWITHAANNN